MESRVLPMPEWAIAHESRNVHIVTVEPQEVNSGDEILRVLLRSDAHHDSPKCNTDMETRHLEQAVEDNALIMDLGDLFDVMQTRRDPRREMGGKLPEHEQPNYLDLLVDDFADFYEPFADRWVMFGRGNHETALTKNLSTDLTERLVGQLKARVPGAKVQTGGYSGWVRFRFEVHGSFFSVLMHYYHGSGGSAPVTQGTIHSQRNSRKLPDANIVWTGHTHTEWQMTWPRWRISRYNRIFKDEQIHVCTPGYKDDTDDGYDGWAVQKNNEPKPLGAAWLSFRYTRMKGTKKNERDIVVHCERAK